MGQRHEGSRKSDVTRLIFFALQSLNGGLDEGDLLGRQVIRA